MHNNEDPTQPKIKTNKLINFLKSGIQSESLLPQQCCECKAHIGVPCTPLPPLQPWIMEVSPFGPELPTFFKVLRLYLGVLCYWLYLGRKYFTWEGNLSSEKGVLYLGEYSVLMGSLVSKCTVNRQLPSRTLT